MWLTRFTHYLLEHRWQTLILVFVISMLPIIGVIGVIIAALVTLSKSVSEGAILTLAATLPCLSSFYLPDQGPIFFIWAMFGFTVLNNLFTWVFAVMLRRQMSFSVVIQIAALIGVLAVSIVHLAYPNIIDWWGMWGNQLQLYYARAQEAMSNNPLVATNPQSTEEVARLIDNAKQYTTGSFALFILISAISTVVIAQWWQAKVFNPGNVKRELHYIRLNQLTGFLFLISLVLAYWGNSVVIDVMPIVNVLFFAAGLSLIHYLFGLMKSPLVIFWLTIFYIILIFVNIKMPTTGVLIDFLIIVVAFNDIWLDFRTRFKTV